MDPNKMAADVDDIVRAVARSAAAKYPRAGLDDLIQEGRIAAWGAAEGWDEAGGRSWRAYAKWAIRANIMRAAWEQGATPAPRYRTVLVHLAATGKGTEPPRSVDVDDPSVRWLAAPPNPAVTARQVWAATAALRYASAVCSLAYLMLHRLGASQAGVGDYLGVCLRSVREYDHRARSAVREYAPDLEWHAQPGNCAWVSIGGTHGEPLQDIGVCEDCWTDLQGSARQSRRVAR